MVGLLYQDVNSIQIFGISKEMFIYDSYLTMFYVFEFRLLVELYSPVPHQDKMCGQNVPVNRTIRLPTNALFVWLISHRPAVLFSQNKSASSIFLSEHISTSHQPPAKRTGL
jgi:hypothetical protein